MLAHQALLTHDVLVLPQLYLLTRLYDTRTWALHLFLSMYTKTRTEQRIDE